MVQDDGKPAVGEVQGQCAGRPHRVDRPFGPDHAFAKVECQLPPRYFTDYLTLLKVDGRWQVIAKAFHTVMKEG